MSKQCLDVQQMQHLQELGLDTSNASMLYCRLYDEFHDERYILVESKHKFDKEENAIILDGIRSSVIYCKKITSAYTLQDVLDALPDFINEYCLIIDMSFGVIRYDNLTRRNNPVLKETYFNDEGNTLIDAAYEMLCWCIENGYVKTNKEEQK